MVFHKENVNQMIDTEILSVSNCIVLYYKAMYRYSEYLEGYMYFNVMRSDFSIIAFLLFTISCGHGTSRLSDAITALNLIYRIVTDKNISYLIRYIIPYEKRVHIHVSKLKKMCYIFIFPC